MTDFALVPSRTALINIDMQNCFVERSPIAAPRGPEVVKLVNRLASACRDNGILVIHTAHLVRDDHSNIGVMGEIIPAVREGVIDRSAPSARLHRNIIVGTDDIVLEKPRYGAFCGTDLELILRGRGIDTLIISGICTNICCETTAREANMRDFHVFFMSDATATFDLPGVSADEVQRVVLATLAAAFAQIEDTASMIAKIEAAGGRAGSPRASAGRPRDATVFGGRY